MPPMNALTALRSASSSTPSPFGERLRHWRQRRRLSQLDLAHVAEVSTRHLSYVETGRASPSRDMVLRLLDRLDIPLRERNALLQAAGYAPMYRERALDAPDMAGARDAVKRILECHEPCEVRSRFHPLPHTRQKALLRHEPIRRRACEAVRKCGAWCSC